MEVILYLNITKHYYGQGPYLPRYTYIYKKNHYEIDKYTCSIEDNNNKAISRCIRYVCKLC